MGVVYRELWSEWMGVVPVVAVYSRDRADVGGVVDVDDPNAAE